MEWCYPRWAQKKVIAGNFRFISDSPDYICCPCLGNKGLLRPYSFIYRFEVSFAGIVEIKCKAVYRPYRSRIWRNFTGL